MSFEKRIEELKLQFSKEDGNVRDKNITLEYLDEKTVVTAMPIQKKICTANGIVNGLELGVVANCAGAYLAMVQSEFFTPLIRIKEMRYYRPTKLGQDKMVTATANLLEIRADEKRKFAVIQIEIKNGTELKAKGTLEYALLSKPYLF